jgi:hypothetical protein
MRPRSSPRSISDRFIVGRRWIAVGGSACRSVLDERHNQFGGVLVLEGSPFMTAV